MIVPSFFSAINCWGFCVYFPYFGGLAHINDRYAPWPCIFTLPKTCVNPSRMCEESKDVCIDVHSDFPSWLSFFFLIINFGLLFFIFVCIFIFVFIFPAALDTNGEEKLQKTLVCTKRFIIFYFRNNIDELAKTVPMNAEGSEIENVDVRTNMCAALKLLAYFARDLV